MANENENIQEVPEDTLLDFHAGFSNFAVLYRGIVRTWIDDDGILWAEIVDGTIQRVGPVASYYYAVQAGFEGTVQQWIALLMDATVNAQSAANSADAALASRNASAASANASAASALASATSALASEQWATGNTNGTPSLTNNSKYYSEQSSDSALMAASSEAQAGNYKDLAATSELNAASSAETASAKAGLAHDSEVAAGISAGAAANSEANALTYAGNAQTSATTAANKLQELISMKGVANGIASLDANGLIPAAQLPAFVDDVLEYSSSSQFPPTGESGKIYVDTSTNITYRWSGSTYVPVGDDLALGETSSTAYRGDRGKQAYDHAVTNKGVSYASGFYKFGTNSEGHVTTATPIALADLTNLGAAAASDLTLLYRQFWTSTDQISIDLQADGKTYLIWCAAASSGTNGAIVDTTYGALIFVSNGKYGVISKGSGIAVTESTGTLVITSSTNIAMGIVEL